MTDLESKGFEVFAVGGCVRDCLLGKIPDDWDLCTSAKPDEMIEALSAYKIIPTGLSHGTIAVKSDENFVEITTYRSDGEYYDCRHPKNVKFVRSIEEDLKRRDFTINAFAYNAQKNIIDLFEGKTDLENKIIRCVGDPFKRFNEDALRIMRAIRFAAVLDFEIESSTEKALSECINLLSEISTERILSELKKIILSKNPHKIIHKYKKIFEYILKTNLFEEDIFMTSQLPQDLPMRFAALLYSVESDLVDKTLHSLKFDKTSCKEIRMYLSLKNEYPYLNKSDCKRFLNRCGEGMVNKCIEFLTASDKNNSYEWQQVRKYVNNIIAKNECYSIASLDISGADIKKLGYTGKEIGYILNILLNAVIDEKVLNVKGRLIKYLNRIKFVK